MMPRISNGLPRLPGKVENTSIAESGNSMKSGKGQLFLNIHPHCTMNITPNGEHPRPSIANVKPRI